MAKRNRLWSNIDWITFVIFLLLVIMGWINIYAAVYDDTHRSIFDISQRYGKQMMWIVAAVVLALAILIIDSNFYVFFAYGIYGFTILLLILVLIVGVEINGSKAWFIIGDFRLQPSEFVKFSTALAISKLASQHGFKITNLASLGQVALLILLPAVLIFLQPDAGSAIVFASFLLVLYREGLSGIFLFFTVLAIALSLLALLIPNYVLLISLFLGGLFAHYLLNQKIKLIYYAFLITLAVSLLVWLLNFILGFDLEPEHILLSAILPSVTGMAIWVLRVRIKRTMGIILVFFMSVFYTYSVDLVFHSVLGKHHQERINELLGIYSDPLGAGYNVNQSKIAIGSGGFWGKGFLQGTQTKFNFVPEQSTDFIFCTVGEEWGFAGSMVVISLFIFLFVRLLMLAERQRSNFSRIYGYSVASILFFHFLVNIGMTMGLMPVIGIPLPFFSYGGSSLWAFTILLFIFLRLDASRLDKLV